MKKQLEYKLKTLAHVTNLPLSIDVSGIGRFRYRLDLVNPDTSITPLTPYRLTYAEMIAYLNGMITIYDYTSAPQLPPRTHPTKG